MELAQPIWIKNTLNPFLIKAKYNPHIHTKHEFPLYYLKKLPAESHKRTFVLDSFLQNYPCTFYFVFLSFNNTLGINIMSSINKTLMAALSVALFSSSVYAANQGAGKITFTGEVIDAPCSIVPGDEDKKVSLGEISTTVLNSTTPSIAEEFSIRLQDCILETTTGSGATATTTTTSKVKANFTSPSVSATDPSLLKNTLEGNAGAAENVGVRLLDIGNNNIALGTPLTVNLPNTNSYQELKFKARMESPSKTAKVGNINAIANYTLDYK